MTWKIALVAAYTVVVVADDITHPITQLRTITGDRTGRHFPDDLFPDGCGIHDPSHLLYAPSNPSDIQVTQSTGE